jgi:hypothetical protein
MQYITETDYQKYVLQIQEIHRLMSGYITYLKQTKQGEGEPGHSLHESIAIYDFNIEDNSNHVNLE